MIRRHVSHPCGKASCVVCATYCVRVRERECLSFKHTCILKAQPLWSKCKWKGHPYTKTEHTRQEPVLIPKLIYSSLNRQSVYWCFSDSDRHLFTTGKQQLNRPIFYWLSLYVGSQTEALVCVCICLRKRESMYIDQKTKKSVCLCVCVFVFKQITFELKCMFSKNSKMKL